MDLLKPRRRDLIGASAALFGLGVGPVVSAPRRKLVVLNATGGWDTTWTVDPKPGIEGIHTPDGEAGRIAGHDVWLHEDRPSVTAFYERWGANAALVRGLGMRSIDHVSCQRRLMTGSLSSAAPDVAAIAANQLGTDRPLPYLLLGGRGLPGNLGADMVQNGATNQIAALLDSGAEPLADVAQSWVPDAADRAEIDAFVGARLAAVSGDGPTRWRANELALARSRAADLRHRAGQFGLPGVPLDAAAQILLAVDLLGERVSWSIHMDSGQDFDTHALADTQGPSHEALFATLLALCDSLSDRPGDESETLLDETIVLVVSEMTRTGARNQFNGNDHWPWATVLLVGGGVLGGRPYGVTDDALSGGRVCFETGDPAEDGVGLQAEHLTAGLLAGLGVEPSSFVQTHEAFTAWVATSS